MFAFALGKMSHLLVKQLISMGNGYLLTFYREEKWRIRKTQEQGEEVRERNRKRKREREREREITLPTW
jgi:hypothetical protein